MLKLGFAHAFEKEGRRRVRAPDGVETEIDIKRADGTDLRLRRAGQEEEEGNKEQELLQAAVPARNHLGDHVCASTGVAGIPWSTSTCIRIPGTIVFEYRESGLVQTSVLVPFIRILVQYQVVRIF